MMVSDAPQGACVGEYKVGGTGVQEALEGCLLPASSWALDGTATIVTRDFARHHYEEIVAASADRHASSHADSSTDQADDLLVVIGDESQINKLRAIADGDVDFGLGRDGQTAAAAASSMNKVIDASRSLPSSSASQSSSSSSSAKRTTGSSGGKSSNEPTKLPLRSPAEVADFLSETGQLGIFRWHFPRSCYSVSSDRAPGHSNPSASSTSPSSADTHVSGGDAASTAAEPTVPPVMEYSVSGKLVRTYFGKKKDQFFSQGKLAELLNRDPTTELTRATTTDSPLQLMFTANCVNVLTKEQIRFEIDLNKANFGHREVSAEWYEDGTVKVLGDRHKSFVPVPLPEHTADVRLTAEVAQNIQGRVADLTILRHFEKLLAGNYTTARQSSASPSPSKSYSDSSVDGVTSNSKQKTSSSPQSTSDVGFRWTSFPAQQQVTMGQCSYMLQHYRIFTDTHYELPPPPPAAASVATTTTPSAASSSSGGCLLKITNVHSEVLFRSNRGEKFSDSGHNGPRIVAAASAEESGGGVNKEGADVGKTTSAATAKDASSSTEAARPVGGNASFSVDGHFCEAFVVPRDAATAVRDEAIATLRELADQRESRSASTEGILEEVRRLRAYVDTEVNAVSASRAAGGGSQPNSPSRRLDAAMRMMVVTPTAERAIRLAESVMAKQVVIELLTGALTLLPLEATLPQTTFITGIPALKPLPMRPVPQAPPGLLQSFGDKAVSLLPLHDATTTWRQIFGKAGKPKHYAFKHDQFLGQYGFEDIKAGRHFSRHVEKVYFALANGDIGALLTDGELAAKKNDKAGRCFLFDLYRTCMNAARLANYTCDLAASSPPHPCGDGRAAAGGQLLQEKEEEDVQRPSGDVLFGSLLPVEFREITNLIVRNKAELIQAGREKRLVRAVKRFDLHVEDDDDSPGSGGGGRGDDGVKTATASTSPSHPPKTAARSSRFSRVSTADGSSSNSSDPVLKEMPSKIVSADETAGSTTGSVSPSSGGTIIIPHNNSDDADVSHCESLFSSEQFLANVRRIVSDAPIPPFLQRNIVSFSRLEEPQQQDVVQPAAETEAAGAKAEKKNKKKRAKSNKASSIGDEHTQKKRIETKSSHRPLGMGFNVGMFDPRAGGGTVGSGAVMTTVDVAKAVEGALQGVEGGYAPISLSSRFCNINNCIESVELVPVSPSTPSCSKFFDLRMPVELGSGAGGDAHQAPSSFVDLLGNGGGSCDIRGSEVQLAQWAHFTKNKESYMNFNSYDPHQPQQDAVSSSARTVMIVEQSLCQVAVDFWFPTPEHDALSTVGAGVAAMMVSGSAGSLTAIRSGQPRYLLNTTVLRNWRGGHQLAPYTQQPPSPQSFNPYLGGIPTTTTARHQAGLGGVAGDTARLSSALRVLHHADSKHHHQEDASKHLAETLRLDAMSGGTQGCFFAPGAGGVLPGSVARGSPVWNRKAQVVGFVRGGAEEGQGKNGLLLAAPPQHGVGVGIINPFLAPAHLWQPRRRVLAHLRRLVFTHSLL